jgi:Uma2 family endonuclease
MTSSPLPTNPSPSIVPVSSRQNRNPTIEDFRFPDGLPTADDLPCSDDKPVDNELQILIPTLLYNILFDLWKDRPDWLFSMDMGLYYDPQKPAIAPDALLSLGIQPAIDENLRSSYVLWQEKVIPLFSIEIVSKTPGGERTKKMDILESIGILYYLIYAPLRKRKAKFQLYKLIEGLYVLQSDGAVPYWMPEIGLAIGSERLLYGSIEREWLFWYNDKNVRYLAPSERADVEAVRANLEAKRADVETDRANSETQRANAETDRANAEATARVQAEQVANALRQRLRKLGIDPDE